MGVFKKHWLALVVLTGIISACCYWKYVHAGPVLQIMLTYSPESRHDYALSLWRTGDGGLRYRFELDEKLLKQGTLTPNESRNLWSQLEEAGAWKLVDEDSGSKDPDVYLELVLEGRRSRSRGWTVNYGKTFQALLNEEKLSLDLARAWTWCTISHRVQAGKGKKVKEKPHSL